MKGWEVGHQVIGKLSNDFLNATGNAMTDQPTYEALLAEVMRLRAENAKLKKRLGLPDAPPKRQLSGPERIALFMSLFSGRQDVYAHRFESKNGQKGYPPTCVNEWHHGICNKPKVKCAECPNRQFVPITEQVVFGHLDTRSTDVKKIIGLYPIREDPSLIARPISPHI